MTSLRKAALACGVLYLLTFVGSIPGALLIEPIIREPGFMVVPGVDGQFRAAALFELVNVLALFGTAVAVFSVVKREHEGLALGFVTTRLFEAAVIAIGVVSILAVVTLREAIAAGGDAASLAPAGEALVAARDWALILGPGMAAFNALMFGTLLFRSRLVPRAIPALGLLGAPLLISYEVGTILGLTGPATAWQAIGTAPFFFWELAVGLWMTLKGFDSSVPVAVAYIAATRKQERSTPRLAPSSATATEVGTA
jgi:hypothetical protein